MLTNFYLKERKLIMKKKKTGLFTYLNKYKLKVAIYILTILIFNAGNIFATIKLADFITEISAGHYRNAVIAGALVVGVTLICRALYFWSCHIFVTVRSDLSYDIQLDLTKQFFKIKTQTFGNVKSGDFINRVCYDPENALDMLDGVLDDFAKLMSFTITTIYILFLNVYIGLILVAFLAVLFILENIKIRIKVKNTKKQKEH